MATREEVIQQKVVGLQNAVVHDVELIMERGEKLERLEDKAKELEQQTGEFSKLAEKTKNKACWDLFTLRLKIASFVLVLIIVAIIVVVIMVLRSKNKDKDKKQVKQK